MYDIINLVSTICIWIKRTLTLTDEMQRIRQSYISLQMIHRSPLLTSLESRSAVRSSAARVPLLRCSVALFFCFRRR